MKNTIFTLIMVFIILSTCKTSKINQNDSVLSNIKNYDEFLENYPDISEKLLYGLYHNCWVFKPDEYYLLSDTMVYEYPTLDSNIIGNLNVHDKIIIIEDVHNKQQINDVTSCWYKINHNNSEAYIFGGNIAKYTYICDIDNNGIYDYFQYRISFAIANNHFDTRNDIVIYINNKKIITDQLFSENGNYIFNLCIFEQKNNEVIITLSRTSPVSKDDYLFTINSSGDISFINHYKKGRFFENGEWKEY
jgi:hypothetical protein